MDVGGVAEAGQSTRRVGSEVRPGVRPKLRPELLEGWHARAVPGHVRGKDDGAEQAVPGRSDAEPLVDLAHPILHVCQFVRCHGHLNLAKLDGYTGVVLLRTSNLGAAPDLRAELDGVLLQQTVGDRAGDTKNVAVSCVQIRWRGCRPSERTALRGSASFSSTSTSKPCRRNSPTSIIPVGPPPLTAKTIAITAAAFDAATTASVHLAVSCELPKNTGATRNVAKK